jgi:hypothetical protein
LRCCAATKKEIVMRAGSQERSWSNSEQWCGVGQQRRGRR